MDDPKSYNEILKKRMEERQRIRIFGLGGLRQPVIGVDFGFIQNEDNMADQRAMSVDLKKYIDTNQKVRPDSSIVERWNNRMVKEGMVNKGWAGALEYLQKYGRNIGAPKVIKLARQAEISGARDVASAFWEKAYALESGHHQNIGELDHATRSKELELFEIPAFPAHLQPGRLAPMQPQDAKKDREYYITNTRYGGQPKKDGEKLIVFSAMYAEAYQSRSMKLRPSPSQEFEYAICMVAGMAGPFILEGEIYYLDCLGKEHMSEATCAARNSELGKPDVMPKMQYSAFSCLYLEGADCDTQEHRIHLGDWLMGQLAVHAPDIFTPMQTAWTEQEKREMVIKQVTEGREGEVWFDLEKTYTSGKSNDDLFVRTKYLTEATSYIITSVAPTTAEGHYIGGFGVQRESDGADMGSIGTGYTREQQIEILRRFATEHPCRVLIVSQGFTNYGKFKHGRFAGWPSASSKLSSAAPEPTWIEDGNQ